MADFVLGQGNVLPALTATLKDGDGNVANLTGATVKLLMTDLASGVVKVNAAATIVSATGGRVSYSWLPADVDTIGVFGGRWIVTYGTSVINFPNEDFFTIEIVDDAIPTAIPLGELCSTWITQSDPAFCECSVPEDSKLDDFISVASNVLYVLSGRQFPGVCSAIVRPCRTSYCDCGGCCPPRVYLGDYVVGVSQVKVDGDIIPASEYRVDSRRYLTRLEASDGNEGWPCWQDLSKPTTEDGTFEVTFTYGKVPPLAGKRAASVLACELAKGCAGEDCKLPARVTTISRQGLTVGFDPFDFLEDGKVGIYEVDLFLATYNPGGLGQRATLVSPDSPRILRT